MRTFISSTADRISRAFNCETPRAKPSFAIASAHLPATRRKANGSPAAIGTTRTGHPADLPTRQLIDAVTPDTPVFVNRLDGHMALANSAALKLAGVDKNTKDVPGGVIVRDASGNPTGILKDAAQALVYKAMPPPSVHQIEEAMMAAQKYAAEQGVTSIQDMSAGRDAFRAYQMLLKQGQLHVRVSGHQPLATWNNQASVGILADFGNDHLHIGGLKGFADGSLGSTTALFFAPYLDSPNTSGIASDELVNPNKMWKSIEEGDAAGLQIAIHAIGDKANNTILNFYERLRKGTRRTRPAVSHRTCTALTGLRYPALRPAARDPVHAALPLHRRWPLGREAHWPRAREGYVRVPNAPGHGRQLGLRVGLAGGADGSADGHLRSNTNDQTRT